MYIERKDIEEYPYEGTFYTITIDTTKPLEERVEEEVVVLATECDIQESQKRLSDTLVATFAVYFPFNKETGIVITRGMKFRGDIYGLDVDGEVGSVAPSQMGGCVAYIIDIDV